MKPCTPCLIVAAVVLTLAACGTAPRPRPAEATARPIEQFHQDFEDNISLDYRVEKKISGVNGKSCYSFITGTLKNQSMQTLSRKSVIDFIIVSQDKMLFRDITNPIGDIRPGGEAQLSLISSPVHKDGCPPYERIKVALRKVVVD